MQRNNRIEPAQPENETGKIDGRDLSNRIQALISHENELRDSRMMWFATLQGLLWFAFAVILDNEWSCKHGFWLAIIIPILGIVVSCFTYCLVQDADKACNKLQTKMTEFNENKNLFSHSEYLNTKNFPVIGLGIGEGRTCESCVIPWFGKKLCDLPPFAKCYTLAFMLGWFVVIVCVSTMLKSSCLQENQVNQTVINYLRFEPQDLERNQTVINYLRLEDFGHGSPRRRRWRVRRSWSDKEGMIEYVGDLDEEDEEHTGEDTEMNAWDDDEEDAWLQ